MTWALLSKDNEHRVGVIPHSMELEVTSTKIVLQSGQTPGVFHLRALRNDCDSTPASGPCVSTSLWVVVSDFQQAGIAFLGFALVVGLLLMCVARLRPPPETAAERERRSLLGKAEAAYGATDVDTAGAESRQLQSPATRVTLRPPPSAAQRPLWRHNASL